MEQFQGEDGRKGAYIDPHDEEYENELVIDFHKIKMETKKDGMVDMNKLRLRSDELYLLSWSSVYKEIERDVSPDEMQSIIAERPSSTRRMGRMSELMKILRRLKKTGHRWIIVADRVFLLTLVVYV